MAKMQNKGRKKDATEKINLRKHSITSLYSFTRHLRTTRTPPPFHRLEIHSSKVFHRYVSSTQPPPSSLHLHPSDPPPIPARKNRQSTLSFGRTTDFPFRSHAQQAALDSFEGGEANASS